MSNVGVAINFSAAGVSVLAAIWAIRKPAKPWLIGLFSATAAVNVAAGAINTSTGITEAAQAAGSVAPAALVLKSVAGLVTSVEVGIFQAFADALSKLLP